MRVFAQTVTYIIWNYKIYLYAKFTFTEKSAFLRKFYITKNLERYSIIGIPQVPKVLHLLCNTSLAT